MHVALGQPWLQLSTKWEGGGGFHSCAKPAVLLVTGWVATGFLASDKSVSYTKVYETVSLAVIHLSASAFWSFKNYFFSPEMLVEDLNNGYIDLNNSCTDYTSSTRLNHTQLMLQALSSEGKKVRNVFCLWPLTCHLLSSSDHSSNYSVIQLPDICFIISCPGSNPSNENKYFFKDKYLVCKLAGMTNHSK